MFIKFLKVAFILIISGLISIGCNSSSDDGDSTPAGTNTPTGTIDNSKFYGVYSATLTIGDCDPDELTIIVGNDDSQRDTEGYIYVPETESLYNTSDGGTISASDNTVSVDVVEDDGDTVDIDLVFNETYNAFTISGEITDDDPGECSGTATGNATLITRTPIDVSYRQITYRTFSDRQSYSAWIEFTKDGDPVDESDIASVVLIKEDGGQVSTDSNFYDSSGFYWGEYNDSTGEIDFSDLLYYSGFSLALNSEPTQGEYMFEVETNEGYSLYNEIYFPGVVVMPVHLATSMSSTWNGDDSLTLSWDNPAGDYEQVRVNLYQEDGTDLMLIKIDATSNVEQITIPSEWVQKIDDIKSPGQEVGWQIQTHKYSDDGNYARGLSDIKAIPSP